MTKTLFEKLEECKKLWLLIINTKLQINKSCEKCMIKDIKWNLKIKILDGQTMKVWKKNENFVFVILKWLFKGYLYWTLFPSRCLTYYFQINSE